MKRLFDFKKGTRGSALVVVIIALAMLLTVGSAILSASAANVRGAVEGTEYKSAYYDGESAVYAAADALKKGVDRVYNEMKSANQVSMDADTFMDTAIGYATAALPSEMRAAVTFNGFDPAGYTDANGREGYLASGTIEAYDGDRTMRRRVAVETSVKIMPLVQPSQVTNVVSPYDFPDSAAILSGGNFSTGGKFAYLYNGHIYLNEDGANTANGSPVFSYDASGHAVPGSSTLTVKKGDGEVIPMDMSALDWLTINFWSGIDKNAVPTSDLVVVNGNLTITDATAATYRNKTVFISGTLMISITSGGKNLDLYGSKFFVYGSSVIYLSTSSKPINAGKNGFNNCMIVSNGSVMLYGKPDNLYESIGPTSGMYLYTNGALSISGGNASDTLYAVIYVKGAADISSQVRFEGQFICEGAFNYSANSNPTIQVTYNRTWTESFYDALAGGLGGILPSRTTQVVVYGDVVIDSTQIPYVAVQKVREID